MPSIPGRQSDALKRILTAAAETFATHGFNEGFAASQFAAVHSVVVYLMGIAPMAYYEEIHSDLNRQLTAVSEAQAIPLAPFHTFAD